jgi:hypothetical protein
MHNCRRGLGRAVPLRAQRMLIPSLLPFPRQHMLQVRDDALPERQDGYTAAVSQSSASARMEKRHLTLQRVGS